MAILTTKFMASMAAASIHSEAFGIHEAKRAWLEPGFVEVMTDEQLDKAIRAARSIEDDVVDIRSALEIEHKRRHPDDEPNRAVLQRAPSPLATPEDQLRALWDELEARDEPVLAAYRVPVAFRVANDIPLAKARYWEQAGRIEAWLKAWSEYDDGDRRARARAAAGLLIAPKPPTYEAFLDELGPLD